MMMSVMKDDTMNHVLRALKHDSDLERVVVTGAPK